MKNKLLNKEEELLRHKLNEVEFDYQAADWEAIEKELPNSAGSSSWLSGKAVMGTAIVVGLATFWMVSQNDEPTEVLQKERQEALIVEPAEEPQSAATEQQSTKQETTSEKEAPAAEVKGLPTTSETKKSISEISRALNEEDAPKAVPTEKPSDPAKQIALPSEKTTPAKQQEVASTANLPTTEEEPNIIGLSAPERVCEGELYTVALDVEDELPEGYTIDWYVAGKLLAKDSRISAMKVEDNGQNQFKLVVKNAKGNVFSTYEKSIGTINLPELNFTYDDLKDPYNDFTASVKVDPRLYSSYQWFDERAELLAEGAEVDLDFMREGVHDLVLKAKTTDGCVQTIEKPLAVQTDFDPLAPNAFSPLVQDGTNDFFMPEAFKTRDDQFVMQIMTLDGGTIFETNNVNEAWNGRQNNNGQMMPAGQYIWKVLIRNKEGKSRTFFGNIRIRP